MFRTGFVTCLLLTLGLGACKNKSQAERKQQQGSAPTEPAEGPIAPDPNAALDLRLAALLRDAGFTGTIEQSLSKRLGRPVDTALADLGRQLFFDKIISLHSQPNGEFGNPCSGCHSPTAIMGDTQSIAIGIDSNSIVGPGRTGARNLRRTPTIINTAFYPKLMWDGRFHAPTNDPFDNSKGYAFPPPESLTAFPPNHPTIKHLLIAQAHIPPTELPEMAGFSGAETALSAKIASLGDLVRPKKAELRAAATMAAFSNRQPFSNQARLAVEDVISADPDCVKNNKLFDDKHGMQIPFTSADVNVAVRQLVVDKLNASSEYAALFGKVFPEPASGPKVTYERVALALAEFQISLTFADAPIDRYARGEKNALTLAQKRGGVLFFSDAGCATCHAVGGKSNEMFSDFENHRIGVPQIAPAYGKTSGNFLFDGDGCDEDFGAFSSTGNAADKYMFRTSPLRNVALQPTFFHNGSFTRLEDAVKHHLDVLASVASYSPAKAGVAQDLRTRTPPQENVVKNLDPVIAEPKKLTESQVAELVEFVRNGLLDPRANPDQLCKLLPKSLPSGLEVGTYEGCNPTPP